MNQSKAAISELEIQNTIYSGHWSKVHTPVLEFYDCPKLISIEDIQFCQKLSNVDINVCKRLSEVSELQYLKQLRYLSLEDCGRIHSLSFLENCQELESLYFIGTTLVEDGNLDFLSKLSKIKNVRFANRRHYSLSREEAQRRLESK